MRSSFVEAFCVSLAIVCAHAQGPKPVNSNYPGLTKVSSYLATKYETDNLVAGSQQATDMILVAALAEKTSADVVSQREAKMPFGGFEVPIENEEYAQGHLYILCGLVEQKSSSYAVTKMNPWPMWELVCGKLFRSDPGKIYSIRYVTPNREAVPLTAKAVQSVVDEAVRGLNQLPQYKVAGSIHKLAAVLAIERQTVDEQYFKELALSQIPNDVQVYYVFFLTSDTSRDTSPALAHAAAVMRTPTQLKLVRQISFGQPGFTIIKAQATIAGINVFAFNSNQQKHFKAAMAKTIGSGVQPGDIEILGVNVAGAASSERRRLESGEMATAAEAAAAAAASGIRVFFTVSVPGSATDINARMNEAAFTTSLATSLKVAGIKGVTPSAITFKHYTLLSNEQQPTDDGFTMTEILVIIGSFVLGVMVTTIVGVMGLKKNRAKYAYGVAESNRQRYQTIEGGDDA